MGLLKKVKDILFDEEDDIAVTQQIKITPEMRNEEPETKRDFSIKQAPKEELKVEHKYEEPKMVQSERQLFQNESTFPFFDDFDEKEFDRLNQKVEEPVKSSPKPSTYNYERPRKPERRNEHISYNKPEIQENVEKKKFKPSPIISPVFGVLDKDYSKDDIIPQMEPSLTIEKVRDKAFGEKIETEYISTFKETKTVTIPQPEEVKKKVKTIDELLEDTSDIVVNIDKDLDREVESIIPDEPKMSEYEPAKEYRREIKNEQLEDTLESDLFDLIDQMYDNKEECDE